ncbi:STAS domain-containing protein [Streptomyces sp. NPDC058701]|uniref:STAS domain-containing protein n=1 Tax=Streptomyces sp. NPDC058701 TaxID=3346608 RepID=UPI003663D280
MTDAEAEKVVATRIAAYFAAVPSNDLNPAYLAREILRVLDQAGLIRRRDPKPPHYRPPGEQHVVSLPDLNDGARVIICTGEFDQQSLTAISKAGAAATSDPTIRRVVLDVSRITFADSSMLNEMFRLLRTSRLILVGPLPRTLDRVLELTQSRALFQIADSIETARTL